MRLSENFPAQNSKLVHGAAQIRGQRLKYKQFSSLGGGWKPFPLFLCSRTFNLVRRLYFKTFHLQYANIYLSIWHPGIGSLNRPWY